MNVRHLRAKYQIEQYPVVFTFPEQVLYEPRVRVEVVSGVDPAPQAFAGLPFVRDNLVAVLVAGGVPGVIYKISCEVDISGEVVELAGVVAIKHTAGLVPEGTSALPLTLTVTTPPYPLLVVDSIGVNSAARDGAIRDLPSPVDNLAVFSQALDGKLMELIVYYEYLENIQVASRALNGLLFSPVQRYNTVPESINVTSQARNGVLRVTVLQYINYEPESINVTSQARNGVLA